MRADWFLPRRLARRLLEGEVGNQEVAHLLLAGLLFSWVIYYGAFTWANPPWTALSLLEALVVVVVTVLGFVKCYDAAGVEANGDFARQFACLAFGANVWATGLVWAGYWAVLWLLQLGVIASFRFDRMGLAQNLAAIGGSFGWLWTVLAIVLWQVVFFAILRPALAAANPARASPGMA